MSDTASPSPKYQAKCHLAGLRYLLAGDLESTEHIDLLTTRIDTIPWDDPNFIRFTEEMRVGLLNITPECAEENAGVLLDLLNFFLSERAEANENLQLVKAKFLEYAGLVNKAHKQVTDLILANASKANKQVTALTTFVEQALPIFESMRDRLEVLGDDVSKFELPPILPTE